MFELACDLRAPKRVAPRSAGAGGVLRVARELADEKRALVRGLVVPASMTSGLRRACGLQVAAASDWRRALNEEEIPVSIGQIPRGKGVVDK